MIPDPLSHAPFDNRLRFVTKLRRRAPRLFVIVLLVETHPRWQVAAHRSAHCLEF